MKTIKHQALVCFFSIVGFGTDATSSNLDSSYIIEGLVRTESSVVETEIQICKCLEDHNRLEQVLLATGLFYKVNIESIGKLTQIKLQEKWTTIPIFKVNSGGGVQGYTFGVYDPNVLGRRVEIGTQYENLAGAPSIVFWNKLPRLLDTKFFSDLQVWRTQRIRLKYNQLMDEPKLIKALLQKSNRDYFAIGYEWSNDFRSRLFIEQQNDQFSLDRIPESTLNEIGNQTIPDQSLVNTVGMQLDLGNTEIIRHSPVGTLNSFQIKLSTSDQNQQNQFQSAKLETLHYRLFDDYFFGLRLQLGSTNSELIQFWNYLGGFESIRGFKDNRFASRNYWLMNFESRYFLLDKESYIVQATAFADLLGIDEQSNEIKNLHAASLGLGSRIILPKFYRVTLRFDFAQPIIKSDNQKISFGVQQFF